MKKRIIFSVILILSIFMITGCNNNEHNYKLRITESSWSGWTSDYQPKEVTKEYDVVLGKEYNIDSGNFIFKIKKVRNNSIVIETKEYFSDNEKGIDLRSKKRKFKIYFDKETKLVTPTMDAGNIYYLILVK